jgi:hypothetical protein
VTPDRKVQRFLRRIRDLVGSRKPFRQQPVNDPELEVEGITGPGSVIASQQEGDGIRRLRFHLEFPVAGKAMTRKRIGLILIVIGIAFECADDGKQQGRMFAPESRIAAPHILQLMLFTPKSL